jgi:5-methylcytosine-specific restriction endonuclease McrA
MAGIGNSALTAAAPHVDALQAAAVPEVLLPDAVFPFDYLDDASVGADLPLVGWDDEIPYDDDAAYPASVPEDPFPEALFADVLFTDAASSNAVTMRPRLEDRVAAARALLTADLAADNPGLIDQLHASEIVKSMLAGQQARLTVEFEARHRKEQAERADASSRALSAEDLGKKRPKENTMGVAEQIALARGESPHRGGQLLGMAKALVTEMPHSMTAMETGQLNEEKAMYVVKETACLSVEDRTAVDEELSADTGTFTGVGTRGVIAAVKAAATRRDPRSVTQRASHAASERSVSLRPAPDCMTYFTALLPAHQGVAVYAALTRRAETLKAAGDPRALNQIKADTLVEWTTGTPGGINGIELNLVMTDRTLLQGDSEPARLAGYGTVPAAWARNLLTPGQGEPDRLQSTVAGSAEVDSTAMKELKTWVRRLYTAPGSGDLVAMDSRRRLFPAPLRRFIQIRDDTCRTPYCHAPIRHHDHIIPWHDDGPTSLANGAGLCEACNHTKELPGWKARPKPGPRHTFEITTPTGHTYRSMAPPLPGTTLSGTGLSETGPPGACVGETHWSEQPGPAP